MRFERQSRWRPDRLILALLVSGLCSALVSAPTLAEKITSERISKLPSEKQKAWFDYLARSDSSSRLIESAFDQENRDNAIETPELAPGGSDFRPPERVENSWYSSEQAVESSAVLISFQNPVGGWSKHVAVDRGIRRAGMHWSSQGTIDRPRYIGTFDNASTTGQILFLAKVYQQRSNRSDIRQAVEKGLRYVLDAQYPNGGWPQVYPLEGGYHDDITFNDDAMVHVLSLLDAVCRRKQGFEFIDEPMRRDCQAAFDRGVTCILTMQHQQNGELGLWCAQHDALTLLPSNARAMEPASISGSESVGILKLLMGIEHPTESIRNSIEGGLRWFSEHPIRGLRRIEIDGQDRYVPDEHSEEVYWTRFYDLESQKPIFPGRDGVIYDSFQELATRNRLGYDYLTTKPKGLLGSSQKSWRKRVGSGR